MRKTFAVYFDIDTDAEGETLSGPLDETGTIYKVVIRKDAGVPEKASAPFPKLLHEIGHVLANVFRNPAHAALQDYDKSFLADIIPAGKDLILPTEKEAWKIAQQEFNESQKWALASYERMGE